MDGISGNLNQIDVEDLIHFKQWNKSKDQATKENAAQTDR